jgi:hypothetical protein
MPNSSSVGSRGAGGESGMSAPQKFECPNLVETLEAVVGAFGLRRDGSFRRTPPTLVAGPGGGRGRVAGVGEADSSSRYLAGFLMF